MIGKDKQKDKLVLDDYNNWVHRFGRLGLLIAIIYMFAIPTIISIVYDAFPSMSVVLKGSVGLLALFVPIAISEVISYTPILGSSAYLTFLTGNILNLKLPCVLNALKVSQTEQNTPEGDAIATVAVAASSILTMVIITLGVILLVPLQPLLQNQIVASATAYMLPALFGGMFLGLLSKGEGKTYIKNKLLMILVPVLLISAGAITGVIVGGMEGILILAMLPVTMGIARILWKMKIIRVEKIED